MSTTRIGRKFGKLTVIDRVDRGVYMCACDCGNKKPVRWENLRRGYTKSCGCLRPSVSPPEQRTHSAIGVKAHPLYELWRTMVRRCHSPTSPRYKTYGARGIQVCERWRRDFFAFVTDMGPRPEGTSLDRVDNDGNYEPGNCRWATPQEQTDNSRVAKLVRLGGIVMSEARAARDLGLTESGLKSVRAAGWVGYQAVAAAYIRRQRFLRQQDGYAVSWDISWAEVEETAVTLGLSPC